MPTAIDLFCGAGGLSEGLRQAGFEVVGAVENDPLACTAYRLNHKDVQLWDEDIQRLAASKVRRFLELNPGDLDLLAACPPCQGFSAMRTKNGGRRNRDERNDLVLQVVKFVRAFRPKCIMLENVPGLAKSVRWHRFLRSLEKLHYKFSVGILNTADYGVPQYRRRLVLLASTLRKPEFAAKQDKRVTVRQFIGSLSAPKQSRDSLHNYTVVRSTKVDRLIKQIPKDGGSRTALRVQLRCHQKFDGFWDVYGRMSWDKPSPTITGGCINPSKGRFLHPEENRAITLREAALLQTFPKKYRFPLDQGRYPAALLIGNALPPEFIRQHALMLKELISKRNIRDRPTK